MSKTTVPKKVTLEIDGMTCSACSARIEKVIGKLSGVQTIAVNLPLGRATLQLEPAAANESYIIERIQQLGYGAKTYEEHGIRNEADSSLGSRLILSSVLTLPIMWAMVRHYGWTSGIWIPELFLAPWFQWLLATPIQFVIGGPFYANAFKSLRNKTANMDVLVVLSTTCAYMYSHYMTLHALKTGMPDPHGIYFESSAMMITVVLLGKRLEASAKRRSLQAIHLLRKLEPEAARILKDGISKSVALETVRVGDILIVQEGELIPLDGIVLQGHTTVDEAHLTGEAIPVPKKTHDSVSGGSRNIEGTIDLQVTAAKGETTLAKVVRFIEEAQGSKADIQRYADRMTAFFVPTVIMLAIITFVCWIYVLSPGDAKGAMFKAIAVLVIACPCALGLATPISILVGTSKALQAGILFREGKYVEQMAEIDVVLLDKTGTITFGTPSVMGIHSVTDQTMRLLRLVASAEMKSKHPFAGAILREAARQHVALREPDTYHSMPGFGVSASVEGHEVLVGSSDFMKLHHIRHAAYNELTDQCMREGKSVLHAVIDSEYAGVFVVSDTLKPTSPQAVRQLNKQRLDVAMLTGDQQRTAEAVARQTGIRVIYADMKPTDKLQVVKKLQQQGKKVAVVGDGMNDAPALAAADIGIAVGTGTDVAKETADINLLHGDLRSVAEAFRISRATMRNIRQNLTFALVYNVLAIPLAFMGLLTPWIAGAAMALSSVSVVVNALRLQKRSPR
ncbi:heavy metal translocating P-type ATPase [Paenibacillus oryzisoli]|uniref:P-type Cu(+) transporter n=1 Tax=Paenibacillus oryzisoli TaxID=1850517 RepID=A0A198A242_9BACL|nr:heavy metal translocating P-type ATPase [Paenibacillus oryzisoli]OAS15073.1 copper-translocating P-type ATPase [Paenibacillus oryzisoli]